jgi:hypothetical protein
VREDAENGRIDPDTQREHQHGSGVKPRRTPHSSQRISEVSKQMIERRPPQQFSKPLHVTTSKGKSAGVPLRA